LSPSSETKPIRYVCSFFLCNSVPNATDAWLELVAGDHTRTVSIATPTTGGLMGFVKKTLTCMGCKTPLPAKAVGDKSERPWPALPSRTLNGLAGKTDRAVCKNCQSRTPELYAKQLAITAGYETSFARLWTQCQVRRRSSGGA
jgi:DNA polymerase delta subunit 1